MCICLSVHVYLCLCARTYSMWVHVCVHCVDACVHAPAAAKKLILLLLLLLFILFKIPIYFIVIIFFLYVEFISIATMLFLHVWLFLPVTFYSCFVMSARSFFFHLYHVWVYASFLCSFSFLCFFFPKCMCVFRSYVFLSRSFCFFIIHLCLVYTLMLCSPWGNCITASLAPLVTVSCCSSNCFIFFS